MMTACEIYDVPEGSSFPEGAVPEIPEKRCYTIDDLQNILLCAKSTVYEIIKRNEFSYVKLGKRGYRISRRSFDEWLDKQNSAAEDSLSRMSPDGNP